MRGFKASVSAACAAVFCAGALTAGAAQAASVTWKYVDPATGTTVYASSLPKGVKGEKVQLPNYAQPMHSVSPSFAIPRAPASNLSLVVPPPLPMTAGGGSLPFPQALPPLPGEPPAAISAPVPAPSATASALTANNLGVQPAQAATAGAPAQTARIEVPVQAATPGVSPMATPVVVKAPETHPADAGAKPVAAAPAARASEKATISAAAGGVAPVLKAPAARAASAPKSATAK